MSWLSYRDDAGRLVRTEMLRTKDITQRIKMKGYWQVHFNICEVYGGKPVLVAYFHVLMHAINHHIAS